MNKKSKFIDYPSLLKECYLALIRKTLEKVSEYGLNDGHHFYITFVTNYTGNKIPEYLIKEYPKTMVIVLENEFWDLEILEKYFYVSLKFRGKEEKLKIFFYSITSFVDPSVSFNLSLSNNSIGKKSSNRDVKKPPKRNKKYNKKKKYDNIILFKPNKK